MTVSPLRATPHSVATDFLVLGMFEGEKQPRVDRTFEQAFGKVLHQRLLDHAFTGKRQEALVMHTHGAIPARQVLVVGLGKRTNVDTAVIREASALAAKRALQERAKRIALVHLGLTSRTAAALRANAAAITEGVLLGTYRFDRYYGPEGKKESEQQRLEAAVILVSTGAEARTASAGIVDGQLVADMTCYARDLVNTPAMDMTPRHLYEAAEAIAKANPRIKLKAYDRQAAGKLGMGAFLAVAKGSDEPPYFLHLSYTPARTRRTTKKLFLLGKGVTFDSGGLHIKPWGYMETMKIDMAGGAVVLALFSKLTALNPQLEIHGIVPAAENMPSGKATKPGDIATTFSGKTVEVVNTDAEGRLLLSDALAYAVKAKADYIVDLATLTGACVVALGEEVAGLFSNNRRLSTAILRAAAEGGEALWELPLSSQYRDLLKSKVADLRNDGTRWGGAIMGALFLQEFVGETPWAHIDIAGPAWAERERQPSMPMGGTGFGVRIILKLIRGLERS